MAERREIDLGLDPRDPWAVIPPERRARLREELAELARARRKALESAATHWLD